MAMKWFWALFVFVSSDIRAEDESKNIPIVFSDDRSMYAAAVKKMLYW